MGQPICNCHRCWNWGRGSEQMTNNIARPATITLVVFITKFIAFSGTYDICAESSINFHMNYDITTLVTCVIV